MWQHGYGISFSQFLMNLTAFVLVNFSDFLSVQHTLNYQGGCGAC